MQRGPRLEPQQIGGVLQKGSRAPLEGFGVDRAGLELILIELRACSYKLECPFYWASFYESYHVGSTFALGPVMFWEPLIFGNSQIVDPRRLTPTGRSFAAVSCRRTDLRQHLNQGRLISSD